MRLRLGLLLVGMAAGICGEAAGQPTSEPVALDGQAQHSEALAIYSNLCRERSRGEAQRGMRIVVLRSSFESEEGSAPGLLFVVQFAQGEGRLRTELAVAQEPSSELRLRSASDEAAWSFSAIWGERIIEGTLVRLREGAEVRSTERLPRVDPSRNIAPDCQTVRRSRGWAPNRPGRGN